MGQARLRKIAFLSSRSTCDPRTNMHFTPTTDPLKREDLDKFVRGYYPENRRSRKAKWN